MHHRPRSRSNDHSIDEERFTALASDNVYPNTNTNTTIMKRTSFFFQGQRVDLLSELTRFCWAQMYTSPSSFLASESCSSDSLLDI